MALLIANLPGQVVSFPRIELPNSLQTGFPIDWRYEHGWPWTYLVRAEFDHTFQMHMPMLWDGPSSADCWKLWSDLPRLHYLALIGNLLIAGVFVGASGVGFEWWRRRRNRIWQLHLLDVFLFIAVLSGALALWMASRSQYLREQQVLSLPSDPTAPINDEFPLMLIESHSVQRRSPSWIRLLSEESPLRSFDRVIGIEVPASELPKAIPFRNLRTIAIHHEATDRDLATLSRFRELEALRLFAVSVNGDDEGAEPQLLELPAMPHLRGLSLSLIRQPVAGLSKLQSLEVLELDECAVNNSMLDELESLKRLRELSLAETKITSEGLEHLAGLSQLEKLVLDDTLIDDSGLSHLSGLLRLNDLSLARTHVSGDGLRHLDRLPHLQILSLIDTEISDADIEALKRLRHLKWLTVSNRRLSDDAISVLRRELPHCDIHVLNTR
ncbi:MAG TPA: hypothetical protein VMP01_08735 [Pirellulaceae bacterium]|nr:hypothetical protein [Pirellulaceae bacterium]